MATETDIAQRFERYLRVEPNGVVIVFRLRDGTIPPRVQQNPELINELRRQGRAKDPG